MKFSLASGVISAAVLMPATTTATNFLVIQPDDMKYYEEWNPPPHHPWAGGAYPGEDPPSPSGLPWINKLRNEGMWLTQAYAASPRCGTSRYSTVTGRYASRSATGRLSGARGGKDVGTVDIPRTKLQDVSKVVGGNDCSVGNVAQVFRKNGFATGMVGKWHLTDADAANGTVAGVKAEINACGFEDVEAMYPNNLGPNRPDWLGEGHHNMEYMAYKAVEFVTDNSAGDWFLYFNPTVPHSPEVSEAFTYDCRITTDGDYTTHMSKGWSVDGMTKAFGDNCTAYREDVVARAGGSLEDKDLGSIWVDDAIGAIYKALNNTNQLEDTFILFQLDHGVHKKDQIWEGGVKIPQFVHYPNGNLPDTWDGLVSTIDIAPTMLDIAEITADAVPLPDGLYDMDGKSWHDAATGDAAAAETWADRCLFFESDVNRAVRCGCDKYMLFGTTSGEVAEAAAGGYSGWDAGTTEALADLCDSGTTYTTASESKVSPEATNEILGEPDKKADLATLLQCHLNRTNPINAKTDAPEYKECAGSVATPSPTVTAQPSTPVANNGGVPLWVDSFPWQNELHAKSSTFKLSATVIDDDITKVRFRILKPDGSVDGFAAAIEDVSARSGHMSTWDFELNTLTPGKYGYRIRMQDGTGNYDYPEDDFIEFVVAEDAEEIVAAARQEIEDIIDESFAASPSVNLAAKFARHGFHDCVGGCDGCVHLGDGDNAGLDIPIDALEPVAALFSHHGVTRADIWVLAALEGVRGQQDANDPDSHREFTMDWYGRPTCMDLDDTVPCLDGDCSSRAGPERHLPSPNLDTQGLLDFFFDEFGFNDRDTVAIMGVHDLGILQRKNSGYNGENGWHGQSRKFSNLYYNNLIGGSDASATEEELLDASNWVMTFVDNSDLDGIPDRWQWARGTDLENPQAVMINSDMAIARDLAGQINATTGEVAGCEVMKSKNTVPCPAASTINIVKDYKFDQALFFEEFESAFKRMLNTGCSDCESCLSPPCEIGTAEIETTARRNLRAGNGN